MALRVSSSSTAEAWQSLLGLLMRRGVQAGARASKASRAATCNWDDVRLTFPPGLVAGRIWRIDSLRALTDRLGGVGDQPRSVSDASIRAESCRRKESTPQQLPFEERSAAQSGLVGTCSALHPPKLARIPFSGHELGEWWQGIVLLIEGRCLDLHPLSRVTPRLTPDHLRRMEMPPQTTEKDVGRSSAGGERLLIPPPCMSFDPLRPGDVNYVMIISLTRAASRRITRKKSWTLQP